MRGVIYCRASAEQAPDVWLPTQLKVCRKYCERNDIEIAEVFEDTGPAAKTTDRPGLQQLLTHCTTDQGTVRSSTTSPGCRARPTTTRSFVPSCSASA